MVFFDLNIPYVGGGGGKENQKNARVKIVVKAMELGYSGIAYNFSVRGVVADCHRCSIRPFPLSSLLDLAPSLTRVIEFHREILGVHRKSPFRQYTRLTVTVDSMIHAPALDYSNPILKTYDLVAVQPMSQATFEHACQNAKVDIIAIDFSQKLPFRLKSYMVKAAIQRGLYFELIYSPLLSDVRAKRETIQGAKFLVGLTGGKNVIVSSSASTVNVIRGPYDAANLSTLLGLSMQHAKAAVSRNCRSIISNALRRRQFYKEAIRVENIASSSTIDDKNSWLGDWSKWDPISSGEGDLSFEKEPIVADTHKLEVASPTSSIKQINEQSEILKSGNTPKYLRNDPLAAEEVLQSHGLIKLEASISLIHPMEEDHAKTSMATEDSTLLPTSPVLLPSPRSPLLTMLQSQTYSIANQVPVNENAVMGLRIKGSPQKEGACLLKSGVGLDICQHPNSDTIVSVDTSMVADEEAKSIGDASCNKQEQENGEKRLEICREEGLQPSLVKSDGQDSSCFGTPLPTLQSYREKRMFHVDASMYKNMLLAIDERNDCLSLITGEVPDSSESSDETPGHAILLHKLENPNVVTTHISASEKFKTGKKHAARHSLQTVHPLSRKIMLNHSLGKRINRVNQKIWRKR